MATTKPIRRGEHALTQMLFCGECGSPMHANYSGVGEKKHAWTCSQRVRAAAKGLPVHPPVFISNRRAMTAVRQWIEENREGGEDMVIRTARAAKVAPTIPSNSENLQSRVNDLSAQKLDLTRQKMRGKITEEEYDLLVDEVNAALAQMDLAITAARVAAPKVPPTRAMWDSLEVLLDQQASPSDVRRLLGTVVSGIVVTSGPWSDSKVRPVAAWL